MATSGNTSTAYANYLKTSRASVLIKRIFDLTEQLQADLVHADRKHLFYEIRDIRRSLSVLEDELCAEKHEGHGDSC